MLCQLHLGAHRTGTTALQKLLETRQPQLRAQGIGVLGPAELRGWGLSDTLRMLMDGDADPDRIAATREVLADYTVAGGPLSRLVVSDENLTGSLRNSYETGVPYPEAATRLAALARVLPVPPDLVCFTIRDFAGYWQSAYAHLASRQKAAAFQADRLAASPGLSWMPVLRAVRAAFPQARLKILGYDQAIVPRLLQDLVGPEAAARLPKPRRTFGLALTGESAARLKALPPGPERERLSLDLRAGRDTPDRAFSPDQAQALAAAYARDWAELQAGAIVGAALDPGQTGGAA